MVETPHLQTRLVARRIRRLALPTMRNKPVTLCTKKHRYHSRKDAKHANRIYAGDGLHSKGIRPYHCNKCGFWHLGHLPPSVIQGRLTRRDAYPS